MSLLCAKNLSFSYSNKKFIDNLNFSIENGQFVCFLGANGSGKSTLTKLFCGEISPKSGFVQILGKDIKTYSAQNLSEIRSVLMQESALEFAFSVKEVVLMGRSFAKTSEKENENYALMALKQADILYAKDKIFTNLSGGEKQRVLIAKALCQIWDKKEKILFLDEPISALDIKHQYLCLKMAKNFIGKTGAVFVVLHDLNLASFFADKIALIKDGTILHFGSPNKVLTEENIYEVFGVKSQILENNKTRKLNIVYYDI